MSDPLHRKNAAEWVMYAALWPLVIVGRIKRRILSRR
jgi:hypothetical protein